MNFLSKKAENLKPYVAGDQPPDETWIKLNTNENPYPPSPKVIEAIKNADMTKLRLYSDGDSQKLCCAIAENLRLHWENVFVGNGSDEVLALAFQTFFSGKKVLMPNISYGFYPVWAQMYDLDVTYIPLKENFVIEVEAYKNSRVIIANPNTPTGITLSKVQIESIIKANEFVIIDEAYIDFGGESVVDLISKYDNLLVVRTFSKAYSLAGLRVGFAVGSKDVIKGLKTVKDAFNSYSLDSLAQIGAIEAIRDRDYFKETRDTIIATRRQIEEVLGQQGFDVIPSQTNFLFVKFPKAKEVYEKLLTNKILVRYWEKPSISDFLRISIGTKKEMEAFITCVKQQ